MRRRSAALARESRRCPRRELPSRRAGTARARARRTTRPQPAADYVVHHRIWSRGPDGKRPGFDQIVQAEAGLMSLTGQPGGTPQRVGLPIADILAGLFGAFGVMNALRARERTGRGQHVETSLLAAIVGVHVFHGVGWLAAGVEPALTGNRHPSIAPYGVFGCADADIVIGVGSEALWRRFAPIVGLDPDRSDIATNASGWLGPKHCRRRSTPCCPTVRPPRFSPPWMRPVCPRAGSAPSPRSTTGTGPRIDGVDFAASHAGRPRRAWITAATVRGGPNRARCPAGAGRRSGRRFRRLCAARDGR